MFGGSRSGGAPRAALQSAAFGHWVSSQDQSSAHTEAALPRGAFHSPDIWNTNAICNSKSSHKFTLKSLNVTSHIGLNILFGFTLPTLLKLLKSSHLTI